MRTKQKALKLIQGLRKAADLIESGKSGYNWQYTDSCNCGMLAKCLLPESDYAKIIPSGGEWTTRIALFDVSREEDSYSCDITRINMKQVIKTLVKNGMEMDDFHNLEYLKDPNVLEKAGIKKSRAHHRSRANVVKYMRIWADILCKEQCEVAKCALNKMH